MSLQFLPQIRIRRQVIICLLAGFPVINFHMIGKEFDNIIYNVKMEHLRRNNNRSGNHKYENSCYKKSRFPAFLFSSRNRRSWWYNIRIWQFYMINFCQQLDAHINNLAINFILRLF